MGKRYNLPIVSYTRRVIASLLPGEKAEEKDYSLAHGQRLEDVGANVQAWTGQKFWPYFGARNHIGGIAVKRMS